MKQISLKWVCATYFVIQLLYETNSSDRKWLKIQIHIHCKSFFPLNLQNILIIGITKRMTKNLKQFILVS